MEGRGCFLRLLQLFIMMRVVACDCTSVPECSIQQDRAICSPLFLASNQTHLPSCIKRLHIIVDTKQFLHRDILHTNLELKNQSFLEEYSILEKTKIDFRTEKADIFIDSSFFQGLPRIRIFRIQVVATIAFDPNAFQHARNLQVIDFTRTRAMNLQSFIQSIKFLKQNPIHTLNLKNVQLMNTFVLTEYVSLLNLSAIICPLAKTLRFVDLSHNEFIALGFSYSFDCQPRLKVLNLKYNLFSTFTSFYLNKTNLGDFFPLLMAEVVNFSHMWNSEDAEVDRFLDEEIMEINDNTLPSVSYAKIAISWMKEVQQHCNGVTIDATCVLNIASILQQSNPLCMLVKCLIPTFDCSSDQYLDDFSEFSQEKCNMTQCFHNVIFPVLPNIKEIHASHIKAMHSKFNGGLPPNQGPYPTLCFMADNNIKLFDMSNAELYGLKYDKNERRVWQDLGITGLHKLRVLNFQNSHVPLSPRFVSDMPSLKELHIGGNFLQKSSNTLLPAYFANKAQLRLFNLSSSDLQAIQYDSLLDMQQLEILDLSHNHFTRDSFHFDLSGTKLSHLILSDNKIESINEFMRSQLDALSPLQLDLTDNPLRCDCSTLEFISWALLAQSHINFSVSHTYICFDGGKGDTLFSVDIDLLRTECQLWRKYVMIFVSTAVSVIAMAGMVIGWIRRWEIRHCMFTIQEKLANLKSENHVEAFEYDAFVLHSSVLKDRQWVHQKLVKVMEKQYGFNLCIHLRDFICGRDILDNVEEALNTSRKVIAVLSPSFASSGWCVDELQMAMSMEHGNRKKRKLILVLLEDFPTAAADIPACIRTVMNTRTFLEWRNGAKAEKSFWKRLNTALYQKNIA